MPREQTPLPINHKALAEPSAPSTCLPVATLVVPAGRRKLKGSLLIGTRAGRPGVGCRAALEGSVTHCHPGRDVPILLPHLPRNARRKGRGAT